MKKYFFYALAFAITLVSCNKENLSPTSNFKTITVKSQLDNSLNGSATIEGVKTFNDMLWFEDVKSYENALEQLSSFQDIEIDNFNTKYFSYSNEELEKMSIDESEKAFDELQAKEQEIGFSEEGVYINFEKQLNFKSLRKHISDLEENFLNNENPNWDNNPDAHFIPFTNERTLFNQFGEIKIGEFIYVLKENIALKITDSNYETVLAIRNITNGYDKFDNVEVENMNGAEYSLKSTSSGCHYSSSAGKYYPHKTNYKHILCYVGVRNTFYGIGYSVAFAKTTNYQKNWSNWVKKKANTKSKVSGDYCGYGSGSFTTNTLNRNRKSLTQTKNLGGNNYAGKNLSGYHKGINNYATYSSH